MTYKEAFLDDIIKEKGFLVLVRNDERIPKELTSMLEVYKKMIDGLVTLRFDVEIYSTLEKVDPTNTLVLPDQSGARTSWKDSKIISEKTLAVRQTVIDVIREQIQVKIEQEEQPKEPKK